MPDSDLSIEADVMPPESSSSDVPKWLAALEAHREVVGTVSDRALARRAGVSASAARKYRAGLGVAEVRDTPVRLEAGVGAAPQSILDRLPARNVVIESAPETAPAEAAAQIIERNAHRLDTLPDWMLARDLAVSVDDLRAWRERNAPVAAPAPASSSPTSPASAAPVPHRRKNLQESSKPRNIEDILAPHAHLLGVLSDISVAQRAGLRPSEVAEFRALRATRTDSPQEPAPVAVSDHEDDLPPEPEAPATAAAPASPPTSRKNTKMKKDKQKKSRSRKPAATGKKRGPESPIAKFADLLGVLPDHEVAARAGVTAAGVLKYRHRHGVKAAPRRAPAGRAAAGAPAPETAPAAAPTPKSSRKRGRPPGRVSKLDAYRDVIGVESDREVAEKAGLTTNAVQMYRKKHGIAASGKRGGARASAPVEATPTAALVPAAAAAPTPAASRKRRGRPPGPPPEAAVAPVATADRSGSWYGWRVKVASRGGELDRIVVARDAVAACAAGATAGDVVSIERIGEGIPT